MTTDAKSSRKPTRPPNFTRRGSRFYASVRVPESLRGIVTAGNQTHIRVSLKTDREAEALRRFPIVHAGIKARIESARRESERFTTYRRGLGLDEREEGQTQSNIDFHSFRRWFITKAEQAGQTSPPDSTSIQPIKVRD